MTLKMKIDLGLPLTLEEVEKIDPVSFWRWSGNNIAFRSAEIQSEPKS